MLLNVANARRHLRLNWIYSGATRGEVVTGKINTKGRRGKNKNRIEYFFKGNPGAIKLDSGAIYAIATVAINATGSLRGFKMLLVNLNRKSKQADCCYT